MTVRVVAALNGLVLLVGLLVAGPVGLSASSALATAPAAAPARGVDAPVQAAPVPVVEAPVVEAPPAEPAAEPAAEAVVEEPVPSPVPRTTSTTGFAPYATAGPLVLHSPGDVVEAIGFHQSTHDGAQPQQPLDGLAVRHGLLDQRGRDTHPAGAADVVVDPAREVRSPVTGRVVRAGSYTLYCDHVDEFLVVEPDARPGWEVKVLHVRGLAVGRGDRVEAGVTVVAAGARELPFASQVDAFTGEPSWPHVHVEVVDPSVPDRPGTGRRC